MKDAKVFKTMVRKFIDSTDYSARPVISRDIGKVGNYLNTPMSARNTGISVESLNSLNAQIASQTVNLANEITSETET